MKHIGLLAEKLIYGVGSKFRDASSLPGKTAMKIDPDILRKVKYPKNIIMVTGTNGKTSTSLYIAKFLEAAGKKVVHNHHGANIIQGLATTILNHTSFDFKMNCDYLVLEVDEGTIPLILQYITPSYLVITNLFSDQVDRFGSKENLAIRLKNSLEGNMTLVLNGDDPVVTSIGEGLPNPKIYFGMDEHALPSLSQKIPKQINPLGDDYLSYDYVTYEHLGGYHGVGFDHPNLKYTVEEVNVLEKHFKVNDEVFHCYYNNKYFIYNMVAAISVGTEYQLPKSIMDHVLSTLVIGNGRMEEVTLGKYKTFINLVKNPAGLNQTLESIVTNGDEAFHLFLAVNSRIADGTEIGWLDEGNFEILKDSNLQKFIVCGERREDLNKRLLKAGIPAEKIIVEGDYERAISLVIDPEVKPYILSNYTPLASVREACLKYKD